MSRPTKEELATALAEAARLREQGDDAFFIGKSLLNLNYRLKSLENVLEKTKLFLHAGFAGKEHEDLLKAISSAEKAAAETAADDNNIVV